MAIPMLPYCCYRHVVSMQDFCHFLQRADAGQQMQSLKATCSDGVPLLTPLKNASAANNKDQPRWLYFDITQCLVLTPSPCSGDLSKLHTVHQDDAPCTLEVLKFLLSMLHRMWPGRADLAYSKIRCQSAGAACLTLE